MPNETLFDDEAKLAQAEKNYTETTDTMLKIREQRDCLLILIHEHCTPNVKRLASAIVKD